VQFTLANALRATAWITISLAAIGYLYQHAQRRGGVITWPDGTGVLWILVVWSPIVAIGALFGNTKAGIIVAFAVLLVLVVLSLPHIHH